MPQRLTLNRNLLPNLLAMPFSSLTRSPEVNSQELNETNEDDINQMQELVQQSYSALMALPQKTYPDEVLKHIESETDEKFAVSTLGLWSLRTAYDQGSFKVRTSDMDMMVKNNQMNTPLASHVETTYLFSQDENLRERYSRYDTDI